MKIIDLLNKIANGKEVPKRIIYDQFVYIWNSKIENYQREVDEITTLNWDYITINCLNEPVEILDKLEEKKIPEKIKIEQDGHTYNNFYIVNQNGTKCYLTKHSKMIAETLNQVIDYLKSKGDE
jgi:hypothetical protein